MANPAVTDQDLQNMLNNGAHQVAANYAVFRASFPTVTIYMSELGMTDIIMAYGQYWANQNQKAAVWEKTKNEELKGSDFHVRMKTGVDALNHDVFETVYFQAKTTKTNMFTNGEYAEFTWTNGKGEFQNLLLQNYVASENTAGRPSKGYYICYGPKGVFYVDVEKITLFIDERNNKGNSPPTDVAWGIAMYGGKAGAYGGLAKNTMAAASAYVVD